MEFTKTTLEQLTKKAKKLRKDKEISLFKAKDIISQSYGYKSFNDLKREYEIWNRKEKIVIAFKGKIGQIKFKLKDSDEYVYKDLMAEDLNNVKKVGLKLLSYDKSIKYFKKINSNYYKKIEDLIFYEFASKRLDLKELEKDYKNSDKYEFDKKINYIYNYYEEIPYIVDDYLKNINLVDDSVEEKILLNRVFCFVENRVFDFSEIDEEPIYDFMQPLEY